MNQKKAKQIALTILNLEHKCQNNENISENTQKMEEIMKTLSIPDLFQLAMVIEEINCRK